MQFFHSEYLNVFESAATITKLMDRRRVARIELKSYVARPITP